MKNSREKFMAIFSCLFLFPILLLGFFIASARAEWANHLVISAVQITEGEGKTNHDFIEIYNPTAGDINLKGYRLVKRTKTGVSDASVKSWTDDTIIRAHGWRLWASSDDDGFPASVGADDFTKQTISADNGVAIRFGAADAGEIIDSAAWGAAENIFKEGNIPVNPGVGEALARKPGNGNGNGEDTNDNASDFIVVSNFAPHNSRSSAQSALDVTDNAGSTNSGSPFSSAPSPTPVSINQSSLPAAEAGTDQEAAIGEIIYFDGSDSFDPGGKELSYFWLFGDGETARGESASHAYKSAGEYVVILKASNGAATGEDTLKVKIAEPEFSDKIILSELLPNPAGSDKDGEWIELANIGDKKINLGGWILDDEINGGAKPHIFGQENFIDPTGLILVKRSESKLVLPNAGGEVNLLWSGGKILSKVSYGKAKEGESFALAGGKWQWSGNPTPAKENVLSQPVSRVAGKTSGAKIVAGAGEKNDALAPEASRGGEEDKNETDGGLGAVVSGEITKIADSREKISLLAEENKSLENSGMGAKSENLTAEELGAISSSGNNEKPVQNNSGTENNPWFWGNMALSVLSLFLVWRYQEIKKKIKR